LSSEWIEPLSALPSHYPKGEIEAGPLHPTAPGHFVQPKLLGGGVHQQQIAVAQLQTLALILMRSLALWFEPKAAGGPQAQRGDRCGGIKFGLVIGMPAHPIAAIAVEVEQNRVEARAPQGAQPFPQGQNCVAPGLGDLAGAAVAVVATGIRHPAGEPGQGVATAEQPNRLLLPGHLVQQVLQAGVGFRQPARPMAQPQVGGGHGYRGGHGDETRHGGLGRRARMER